MTHGAGTGVGEGEGFGDLDALAPAAENAEGSDGDPGTIESSVTVTRATSNATSHAVVAGTPTARTPDGRTSAKGYGAAAAARRARAELLRRRACCGEASNTEPPRI